MSGVGTLCAIAHYRAALSYRVLFSKFQPPPPPPPKLRAPKPPLPPKQQLRSEFYSQLLHEMCIRSHAEVPHRIRICPDRNELTKGIVHSKLHGLETWMNARWPQHRQRWMHNILELINFWTRYILDINGWNFGQKFYINKNLFITKFSFPKFTYFSELS